jgi:hypothetical protein
VQLRLVVGVMLVSGGRAQTAGQHSSPPASSVPHHPARIRRRTGRLTVRHARAVLSLASVKGPGFCHDLGTTSVGW